MSYRIRIVPEVEVWRGELRETDPRAANLLDAALDALREGGAGLGPPLVVAVPVRGRGRDRAQASRAADRPARRTGGPPATAVLLAASTERDWLRAWYTEMIPRSQARYQRDQRGTG
jgi:hypothetical protein